MSFFGLGEKKPGKYYSELSKKGGGKEIVEKIKKKFKKKHSQFDKQHIKTSIKKTEEKYSQFDNQQLLKLQEKNMKKQDEGFKKLLKSLDRIKAIQYTTKDKIKEQEPLIQKLGNEIDRTEYILKKSNKGIKRIQKDEFFGYGNYDPSKDCCGLCNIF